jgi:RNA polymerase sigma factor (sigma-70 family)
LQLTAVKRIYTSDESIIQGILRSDDRALEQLYSEHSEMVRNLILTNSGSEDDAKDVFQDTIIILFEKIRSGKFTLSSSIKTYIYSVSRNLWLYRLRQTKKNSNLNDSMMTVVTDETNIESFCEETHDKGKMTRFINLLGESCKKILMLFYYERLSTKDIALKLHLAGSDYVKTQKYRCLQKLKSLYLKNTQ